MIRAVRHSSALLSSHYLPCQCDAKMCLFQKLWNKLACFSQISSTMPEALGGVPLPLASYETFIIVRGVSGYRLSEGASHKQGLLLSALCLTLYSMCTHTRLITHHTRTYMTRNPLFFFKHSVAQSTVQHYRAQLKKCLTCTSQTLT